MNWSRMSMFKMPSKYRRYNFQPRYYDERKENLEKKIKLYQSTSEEVNRRELSFKSEMQDTWGKTDFKKQSQKANLRLLIILIIIGVATVYIFNALDSAEAIINNNLNQ
ncbi:MAG: hypothetical protein ACWA41_11880 [Putridiphycobacter sp.]